MNTTTVSAVFGNPQTPCSGSGFCDVQSDDIDSPLAIDLTLSSSGGNDLSIHIAQNQLTRLRDVRQDIYDKLMAESSPGFDFAVGALPFYLEDNITSHLWPHLGERQQLATIGSCSVLPAADGDGIRINLQSVSINTAEHLHGCTGDMLEWRSVGAWKYGIDAYENLLFTNDNTMIMFGTRGNISSDRYSMTAASDATYQAIISNPKTFIHNWKWGVDSNQNLYFTNEYEFTIITFDSRDHRIYLSGRLLETQAAETPIPAWDPVQNDSTLSMGGWLMFADPTGNLGFKSNNGCFYYFGADGGIYAGHDRIVSTHNG